MVNRRIIADVVSAYLISIYVSQVPAFERVRIGNITY